MVTLGTDRYIMTSENVKQDHTTKDSGAAFFNSESRGGGGAAAWKAQLVSNWFCFYLQVGVINLIVQRN